MNIKNVKYLNNLKKLEYPLHEMLIVGSGTMSLYGLKENNDIDLWVTKKVYDKMLKDDRFSSNGKMLETKDGLIEADHRFICVKDKVEDHLDRATIVNGFHFQSLRDVLDWKKCMNRPKDHEHIKMIEKYMKNSVVENYLQIIQEGTILSDKILIHNPELLQKSKIFVFGLPGSGKSTLGKYLAEKYNIKYISLDEWFWNIASDMTGKSFDELMQGGFNSRSVIREIEKRIKNYKENAVFDGVQGMWGDRNFILSTSVIVMGTSTLLSSYRVFMRNKNDDWAKNMTIIQFLKHIYNNEKMFISQVKEIRDDILKRNNYKAIDSKEDL